MAKRDEPYLFVLRPEVATATHAAVETLWQKGEDEGRAIARLPRPPRLEEFVTLIETAFWASQETEEGLPTTFSIRWATPAKRRDLILREPLPFSAEGLRKLGPGLAPGNSSLLVSPGDVEGAGLQILGISSGTSDALEVRCARPGVMTVSYGYYGPVFVVLGGHALLIPRFSNPLTLIQQALPVSISAPFRQVAALFLIALAARVRRIGTGGTLAVVPKDRLGELDSLATVNYRFEPDYMGLSTQLYSLGADVDAKAVELYKKSNPPHDPSASSKPDDIFYDFAISSLSDTRELGRSSDLQGVNADVAAELAVVAQLAAVDGAVVLGEDLRVLSFGSHLKAEAPAEIKLLQRAVTDEEATPIEPHRLGGTRHESAAKFVSAVPGAVALVASHDGPLTLIAWDREKTGVVVAHRHLQLLLD